MNGAQGFTLVELLLALSLTMVVVGAAVTVTGDVQRTQASALDDTAAQQEARYAIDWIARVVATAGSGSSSRFARTRTGTVCPMICASRRTSTHPMGSWWATTWRVTNPAKIS
jgi:Tfp pilus assembly protein PilW